MKNTLLAVAIALSLLACSSMPSGKTPQAVADQYCPTVQTVLITLETFPGMDPETVRVVKTVGPSVATVCANPQLASVEGLKALAATSLPVLVRATSESSMSDDEKRAIIITLAFAQAAMSTLK